VKILVWLWKDAPWEAAFFTLLIASGLLLPLMTVH